MKNALVAILLGAMAFSALAQSTPVGLWRSSDDKTGEAKAEIRVTETPHPDLGEDSVTPRLRRTACSRIPLKGRCRFHGILGLNASRFRRATKQDKPSIRNETRCPDFK